jgi:hypothetical protein
MTDPHWQMSINILVIHLSVYALFLGPMLLKCDVVTVYCSSSTDSTLPNIVGILNYVRSLEQDMEVSAVSGNQLDGVLQLCF